MLCPEFALSFHLWVFSNVFHLKAASPTRLHLEEVVVFLLLKRIGILKSGLVLLGIKFKVIVGH
jgi:hypothetical protein